MNTYNQNRLRLVLMNNIKSIQSFKLLLKSNYNKSKLYYYSSNISKEKYNFSQRKWTPILINNLNIYINEKHKIDIKNDQWNVLIQYYYDNIKNIKNNNNKVDNDNINDNIILLLDYFIDNKLLDRNDLNKLYFAEYKNDLLLNIIDIYYNMNNNLGKRKILQIITNIMKNDIIISTDIIEYMYHLFGSRYHNDIIKLINIWVESHKNIVKIINLENISNENFAKLIIDQLLLHENNKNKKKKKLNKFSTLLLFISPIRKSLSRIYFHTNLIVYFYQKFNIKAIDYINDNKFGRYFKEWNNMNSFINNYKYSSYIIRLLNYSKIELMDKMYHTPLIIEIQSNEIKTYINNENKIKLNNNLSNNKLNIIKFPLNDVKELIDVEKIFTFSNLVKYQLHRPINISKQMNRTKEINSSKKLDKDKEINYYKNALEDIKVINNKLYTMVNNYEQIPYI